MERVFLRPSTIAYDGMNSIDEIIGEYVAYLSILSDTDLKREFNEISSAWLGSPTIMHTRMFQKAKQKMLERGLLEQSQNLGIAPEM